MVTKSEAAGRQCILDQAQRMFLAHGYHGVSIRDIVQACGLSNASLYYHFGSKQNLFVQVFKEYVAGVARKLEQAGEGQGSCRERLSNMAQAYAQFILESRSEMQMLHRDLKECGEGEIQSLLPNAIRKIPSLFASVLEQGIAAGEVRPVDTHRVGVLLMGMVNSLTARRMFGAVARPMAEDVDLSISILFEGIGVQR